MPKPRVFWASVFANLLTLVLLPGVAHANNVAVNCPGASFNSAVAALSPNEPYTITVTGTCNENVVIADFRSLTIVAGPGGVKIVAPQDSEAFDISRSQNITLQNLEIAGVPGSTPDSAGTGVNINEQSDVRILGCDIHDNQGGGVGVGDHSLLFLNNTTFTITPLAMAWTCSVQPLAWLEPRSKTTALASLSRVTRSLAFTRII